MIAICTATLRCTHSSTTSVTTVNTRSQNLLVSSLDQSMSEVLWVMPHVSSKLPSNKSSFTFHTECSQRSRTSETRIFEVRRTQQRQYRSM